MKNAIRIVFALDLITAIYLVYYFLTSNPTYDVLNNTVFGVLLGIIPLTLLGLVLLAFYLKGKARIIPFLLIISILVWLLLFIS
jgi:hypothetical protein